MRYLDIRFNKTFTSFSYLKGMKKLTHLKTEGCTIVDFQDVSLLTELRELSVGGKHLDLHPLLGLKNLRYLNIRRFKISDLSPLLVLTNLVKLDIGSADVTDLSPLQSLHKLKSVQVKSNINLTTLEGFEVAYEQHCITCLEKIKK